MRLLTIEQVITESEGKGFPIKREQFSHWSKLGMFCAPDKKTKKRVKEGTLAYYAEEIIEDIGLIYDFKKNDFTLKEIKAELDRARKDFLINFFTEKWGWKGVIIEDRLVEEWKKRGYYQGLLSILYIIFERYQIAYTAKEEVYFKLEQEYNRACEKGSKNKDHIEILGNICRSSKKSKNTNRENLRKLAFFVEQEITPLADFVAQM